MKYSFFLLALLLALPSPWLEGSPEIPGAPQSKPIVIVGATIHTISGETIPSGTIVFDKGKIVAIGVDVAIPDDAEKIDFAGKHIYPGLFDAHTDLGLVEVNSTRATIDHTEIGSINPNVKSWVAVNPDSEIIPVTRSNGILLALAAPKGGLIAGRSAVMQLDGWTYEDMALRLDRGLHVNWPAISTDSSSGSRNNPIQSLRDAFDTARSYQKARQADRARHAIDSRWEAMLAVLDRKIPLIVSAQRSRQIQSAVAFCAEQNLKLILHGGYDAPDCAELLKKHDVPVIVGGIYRLPLRDSDSYDAPFTVPDRLRQAGVRYCISSNNRFGASGVRNLPYHAAMAAAFGLPVEEAIKAITLYPAEILGVADRVGSLAPGKDATLIVTTGDPLDTATQVEAAFIQGRRVELNDRHKRLWTKYETKYKRGSAE